MTRRYTFATTLSFGTDGELDYRELDVEVSYTVTWGAPAVGPSYSHGGLPADPDEIDDIRVEKIDGAARPWSDPFRTDDELADPIAERIYGSDEILNRMAEEAASDDAAAADDYAERLWEERRLERGV